MNIQQLKYFDTASKLLSFSKAANDLFISRQALAKSIHNLEGELGASLFTYCSGRLELTDFGYVMAIEAKKILKSFSEMDQAAKDYQANINKKIQIAIGLGSINALTIRSFTYFLETHPDFAIEWEEYDDETVQNKVSNQQADMGILGTDSSFLEDFYYILIKPGVIYLQISAENPLSSKDRIEIPDLADQPFISLGETCDMHNILVKKCREYGFTPRIVFNTKDSNVANSMVIHNQGISFGHIQTYQAQNPPLYYLRPLHMEDVNWGTYAIFLKDTYLTESEHTLVEFLQSC